jgi:hypothetical protein
LDLVLLLLSDQHFCGLSVTNAHLQVEKLLHCLQHLTVTVAAAWKVTAVLVAAAAAAAAGRPRLCLMLQQLQHALRA